MLVCLQFDSIGRRKRQDGRLGTRQVQCTSAPHGIPDDVAAVHFGLGTCYGTNWSRFNSSWGTSQFRRPSGTSAVPSASPQP
jgi:hypothetical protein